MEKSIPNGGPIRTQIMKRIKDPRVAPHDEKAIERLREDTAFATEYLKAAMEDQDEPRVLLIALRRIAEARGYGSNRA
jgi:DNA-binding phage protein